MTVGTVKGFGPPVAVDGVVPGVVAGVVAEVLAVEESVVRFWPKTAGKRRKAERAAAEENMVNGCG